MLNLVPYHIPHAVEACKITLRVQPGPVAMASQRTLCWFVLCQYARGADAVEYTREYSYEGDLMQTHGCGNVEASLDRRWPGHTQITFKFPTWTWHTNSVVLANLGASFEGVESCWGDIYEVKKTGLTLPAFRPLKNKPRAPQHAQPWPLQRPMYAPHPHSLLHA